MQVLLLLVAGLALTHTERRCWDPLAAQHLQVSRELLSQLPQLPRPILLFQSLLPGAPLPFEFEFRK